MNINTKQQIDNNLKDIADSVSLLSTLVNKDLNTIKYLIRKLEENHIKSKVLDTDLTIIRLAIIFEKIDILKYMLEDKKIQIEEKDINVCQLKNKEISKYLADKLKIKSNNLK